MQTLVGVESVNFPNARQMQSKDDDDNACDTREPSMALSRKLANTGRGCTQRNETYTEP